MSYRDDHAAAVSRIDALEHEVKQLGAANERLEAELAVARNWLGGPRKRALLATGVAFVAVGLGIAGFAVGRMTADPPAVDKQAPREEPLPFTIGAIVADGPSVGHWVLDATTCVPHGDGVELRAAGDQDRVVWLTDGLVEVEVATGAYALHHQNCAVLDKLVEKGKYTSSLNGFVSIDCRFGDLRNDPDRVHGRIEFRNCR